MKQYITIVVGLGLGAGASMASVATASTEAASSSLAAAKPTTASKPKKKKKKTVSCVGDCSGGTGVALVPTCGTGYGLGNDMCKCKDTSGNWGPVVMDCPKHYFLNTAMND